MAIYSLVVLLHQGIIFLPNGFAHPLCVSVVVLCVLICFQNDLIAALLLLLSFVGEATEAQINYFFDTKNSPYRN